MPSPLWCADCQERPATARGYCGRCWHHAVKDGRIDIVQHRRPIPKSKRCALCRKPFRRRDREGAFNWRKRKTCSQSCRAILGRKTRQGHRHLEPQGGNAVRPRPGSVPCFPGFLVKVPPGRRVVGSEDFDSEQDRIDEFWECYGGARL